MKKVLITILLAGIIVGCSPSTKSVSNNDTTKTATSVTTQSKVTTSAKSNSSTSTKEVTKPQTKPNDEIIGKVLDFEKETVKIKKIEKIKDDKNKNAIRLTFDYTNKSNGISGKGNYNQILLAMNVFARQNGEDLERTVQSLEAEKGLGYSIAKRPKENETVEDCHVSFVTNSEDDVTFEFKPGRDTDEVKTFVYKMK